MALHSRLWVVIPFLVMLVVWIIAVISPDTADTLVVNGLLSPTRDSFVLLPGAGGAGLSFFNFLIYIGIGIIVGSLINVCRVLDFVWDEEDDEEDEFAHMLTPSTKTQSPTRTTPPQREKSPRKPLNPKEDTPLLED